MNIYYWYLIHEIDFTREGRHNSAHFFYGPQITSHYPLLGIILTCRSSTQHKFLTFVVRKKTYVRPSPVELTNLIKALVFWNICYFVKKLICSDSLLN